MTKVKVFFSDGDPDECASVEGWTRSVPAGADPVRYAFDELVKGPTSSEVSAGAFSFFSRSTAGMVRSTTTDGDVLVVDFDDFRAVPGMSNAGSSCGSGSLLGQLDATAFQFAGIDLVRYELEGSCQEFGAFLQADCIEVERADWKAAVAAQLPGEPFDGILPPGAVLGVVGVEADDVLNVRALPGARQTIVDTLEPLAMGLRFSGRERLVGTPPSVWYEINTGDTIGWVHSGYVAPLAGTVDVTSEVVAAVGKIPTAETGTQIGDIVVEARTRFVDGDLSVVLVDGPRRGDLNEITYDVIGFYDDSVMGERLHLFITPPEVADGPMTLKSVEVTFICARGGGQGELCP
ncbi:MAG: GerMN domain-containing protein [Acidimicrobiia bacterium]|nr:GerMN domain-containing protein [Acidimicrobiia bacterium]